MENASIFDLKAELYNKEKDVRNRAVDKRCKEEVALPKKTFDKIAIITGQKPASFSSSIDKKEEVIPVEKITKTEEEIEYENKLRISSSILEKKSQIYEDLHKKGINKLDNIGETLFLVDFENKKYQSKSLPTKERMIEIEDENGFRKSVSVKKYKEIFQDNPKIKVLNASFYDELIIKQPKSAQQAEKLHLDFQKRKWEEADKKKRESDNQEIYYQDIVYDELRELGVGHYKFSKNSQERAAQLELLNSIRQKTLEQQEKINADKLLEEEKRKKRLDAIKKLRFGNRENTISTSLNVQRHTQISLNLDDYIDDEIKKMRNS